MKKVIFIGGTSYSGSTLLDMILANDPNGYSLGEIHALFKPYKVHHFEQIKKLQDDKKWSEILKDNEKLLYVKLFKLFPEIEFFVDSSKDPFWISKQMGYLSNNNIKFKNILIYKSPQELAHSLYKRGKLKKMAKIIKSYYSIYLHLIKNFKTISYKQLIQEEDNFIKLCDYLSIDYFVDKKKYWEKKHETFFGNNRARIHTSNLKSQGNEKIKNLTQEGKQSLYYNYPFDSKLISKGNEIEREYLTIFKNIYYNNISNDKLNKNIPINDCFFIYRYLKNKIKFYVGNIVARVKYEIRNIIK